MVPDLWFDLRYFNFKGVESDTRLVETALQFLSLDLFFKANDKHYNPPLVRLSS